VPPQGKGPLYLRPLLMGSGPILGLAPAPEYTFLIYAAPVGYYFKVSARIDWTRSLGPGDVRDVNNHRAWSFPPRLPRLTSFLSSPESRSNSLSYDSQSHVLISIHHV